MKLLKPKRVLYRGKRYVWSGSDMDMVKWAAATLGIFDPAALRALLTHEFPDVKWGAPKVSTYLCRLDRAGLTAPWPGELYCRIWQGPALA